MKKIIFLLLPLFFLSACKQNEYLSSPKDFKYQVKGLHLEINLDINTKIIGEIIEVNARSITILPIDQDSNHIELMIIPKKEMQQADILVAGISDNPKTIKVVSGLAISSTAGHGIWILGTLPLNVIVAVPLSVSAAKSSYRVKYPDNVSWKELHKFARFPQGIPENINKSEIK